MTRRTYEVHALLEHAVELAFGGDVLPGFVQLELLACQAIAADLAFGTSPVAVVLPDTLPGCLEAVASRTDDWGSNEGSVLVEMVGEIRRSLQRA